MPVPKLPPASLLAGNRPLAKNVQPLAPNTETVLVGWAKFLPRFVEQRADESTWVPLLLNGVPSGEIRVGVSFKKKQV